VKDNKEYLGNIPFVEMIFSKLMNYSTDMCWNGQGTMVKKNNQELLLTSEVRVSRKKNGTHAITLWILFTKSIQCSVVEGNVNTNFVKIQLVGLGKILT
jgi:hypothetical protein